MVLVKTDLLADALKDASDAINSGQSSLAVDKLDIVLELNSLDTLSLFKRAVLCIALGRYEKALKDLDNLLLIKPNHSQGLLQRAKIYILYGKLNEALVDAQASDSKDELVAEIQQLSLTIQNLNQANDSNQISLLSSVIQKCPLAVEYRIRRADIYSNLGDSEMAIVDYSRVVQLKPDDLQIFIKLAKLRLSIGEIGNSINTLKDCLRSDPDQKECKSLYRELKKINKKLDSLHDAVEKKKVVTAKDLLLNDQLIANVEKLGSKSLNGRVYGYACKVFTELKKNEEASSWCKKAVDAAPQNAEYNGLLADCMVLMEEYEDAMNLYKKANELDPQNHVYKEGYQKAQRLMRQAGRRDYYKILGVPRSASQRDIKKAFRKLAQIWHPDKYRGDLPKEKVEAKMGEINLAYEVLSNEELRTRFDNGDDPNDQESNMFGGGHQFGGFGGFPFQFTQGGDGGHGQQFFFQF